MRKTFLLILKYFGCRDLLGVEDFRNAEVGLEFRQEVFSLYDDDAL